MKTKPVPPLDELPNRDIIKSLQELYSLSPGETQVEKNYAVIRMVTIIEDVCKHLARRVKKPHDYDLVININRDTLRNVLREPETAEYTHKRILAETLSFQNLKVIQGFRDKHAEGVQIPKSLDGLFKERHDLVHSVVDTKFDEDEIENIRNELLKFLLNISCKCISGVTPNFLNGLVRGSNEGAAEYFELTIKERQLSVNGEVDFNAALEIGAAYQNLGQYEEAVKVYSKCIKQLNKDGAEKQSNVDGANYYKQMSDSLQELNKNVDALKMLEVGLKRYPENLHLLIAYCALGSKSDKNIVLPLMKLLSNNVLWSNSNLKCDIFLMLSQTFYKLPTVDIGVHHEAAALCRRKYEELDAEMSKR